MRHVLSYNIISDAELKTLIDNARKEQRQIESGHIKTLLRISEVYRRTAEIYAGKPIGTIPSPLLKILSKREKNNH